MRVRTTCPHDCTKKTQINLKVIASIPEGYRLSTHGIYLQHDPPKWHSPVTRMYHGDDRDKTYDAIEKTIDSAINLCNTCLAAEEVNKYERRKRRDDDKTMAQVESDLNNLSLLKSLSQNLNKTIGGLENLMKTYEDDEAYRAKLTYLIEKVRHQMDVLQDSLKKLSPLTPTTPLPTPTPTPEPSPLMGPNSISPRTL